MLREYVKVLKVDEKISDIILIAKESEGGVLHENG